MESDVKDKKLADQGRKKINWARKEMAVLDKMDADFQQKKPLKDIKISACLHVTAETANLMKVLKTGGAEVILCASNPLSTQDDVAASLVVDEEIPVFAKRGVDRDEYYKHLNAALDLKPDITMDDGADLVNLLHTDRKDLAESILGSSEETTTGVIRLKSLAGQGELKFPVVAVNDSKTKYMFDNRYGTGQSTIDGILRATNMLLAGKYFVVAGYGWCGRGIATRARGMGAKVIVTEVDPIKALEARHDGFEVMSMDKASKVGDIFVTATGDINVIDIQHMKQMKDGVVIANAGHFDVELNMKELKKHSDESIEIRDNLVSYDLGGKSVNVIADGRLVNLSSAEGHPPAVMDMSFAGQAMAALYIKDNAESLENKVYALPEEAEQKIASLKLESMGVEIDELTDEQKKYLASWEIGT